MDSQIKSEEQLNFQLQFLQSFHWLWRHMYPKHWLHWYFILWINCQKFLNIFIRVTYEKSSPRLSCSNKILPALIQRDNSKTDVLHIRYILEKLLFAKIKYKKLQTIEKYFFNMLFPPFIVYHHILHRSDIFLINRYWFWIAIE